MSTISDPTDRPGDQYARRLRTALHSKAAVLSIFVGDRQIFIGSDGLPARLREMGELPAMEGFCKYVHDHGCQLVVDDVRDEAGIAAHPAVGELDVQAYAGWHVTGEDGRPVGVLAALEDRPRAWSSGELLALMELAHESGPVVRAAVRCRGDAA